MNALGEERKATLLQPRMIEKLEHMGYYLLPRTHDHSPGFTGLLILLRPRPHPEAVSDPESLHLRLQSRDGSVHWTTIDAATSFTHTRTVCPGPIHIYEHDGTESAFFTFGGTVAAETVASGVVYSLYSAAPILCLTSENLAFGGRLASEAEVLLAKAHAQAGMDVAAFLRRLAGVDAQQLYATILDTIIEYYESSPDLKRGNLHFYQEVEREEKWLQETGQWPAPATQLVAWLGHHD